MLDKVRIPPAGLALLAFVLLVGARAASAQVPSFPPCETTGTQTLPQYTICEVVIQQSAYTNESLAYTEPDVKAVFTHLSDNRKLTAHGFYDRDPVSNQIVFKIRFNTSEVGDWSYDISCAMQANAGLPCAVTGPSASFKVRASAQRGFLRRDPGRPNKFIYDSGFHPFVWGQTYYQIINNAASGSANWQTAVTNSKDKGLNKVRMLLYPWWPYYAPYGDTQPFNGGATTPNHDAINLNHWRKFDEVVNKLYATTDLEGSRMLAEIILFKDRALGTNPDGTPINDNNRTFGTAAQDDRYLKYAVARYAAFTNVMWCLSNEWQIARNDSAYWTSRAATLLGNDPWMFDASHTMQRATSIHPHNEARFSFAAATWPAQDVLQWSVGHGDCVPTTNPCVNSDEWANFSITNNLVDNRPVFNDEYGYINSKLNGSCANVFTPDDQRRGMWAIAVAGGYGTFGDNTGVCASPAVTPPAIRADWFAQSRAYTDTLALNNFFRNNLNNVWWQMSSNNSRVSKVGNTMRVYSMEGLGQYVVYAVRDQASAATQGKFNVNLPVGKYTTTFYDPRGALTPAPQTKKVTRAVPTRFVAPTYDDWALQISAPLPKVGADDTVWVWDNLPAGAITGGDSEGWNWIDSDPTPLADSLAHQSNIVAGMHQHFFYGATETLTVNTGDTLFADVYIDPLNPPSEVMLQWNDGTWEHRAYWGANQIGFGADGTVSRRYMGALPAAGQWVRLQVPASSVGLEGHTLNGMAYTLFGGRATWDNAGKNP
jgi:Protein of unknown function (DUF4038)/Domain of unknown function (DUF5060)